jgi:X-linked retinitis pigmentosa GTPase regulator
MIQAMKDYNVKAAQVSCGREHMLILTDDGEVLTCGSCDFGLLGTGSAVDVKVPIPIEALAQEDVTEVAAGRDHSLVLTNEGKIFSWGRSTAGQLGHGDSMQDMYSMEDYPRAIEPESFDNQKITRIAAMRDKSAAITEDGKLYLWGTRYGQSPMLILPSAFNDMKVIDATMGGDSQQEVIAVITEDQKLWVIGHSNSHMLGTAKASGWNDLPMPVTFNVKDPKILKVFCGPGQHIAAIVDFEITK